MGVEPYSFLTSLKVLSISKRQQIIFMRSWFIVIISSTTSTQKTDFIKTTIGGDDSFNLYRSSTINFQHLLLQLLLLVRPPPPLLFQDPQAQLLNRQRRHTQPLLTPLHGQLSFKSHSNVQQPQRSRSDDALCHMNANMGRGRRDNRPKGKNNRTPDGRVICDLCYTIGHVKKYCPQQRSNTPSQPNQTPRFFNNRGRNNFSSQQQRGRNTDNSREYVDEVVNQLLQFFTPPAQNANASNAPAIPQPVNANNSQPNPAFRNNSNFQQPNRANNLHSLLQNFFESGNGQFENFAELQNQDPNIRPIVESLRMLELQPDQITELPFPYKKLKDYTLDCDVLYKYSHDENALSDSDVDVESEALSPSFRAASISSRNSSPLHFVASEDVILDTSCPSRKPSPSIPIPTVPIPQNVASSSSSVSELPTPFAIPGPSTASIPSQLFNEQEDLEEEFHSAPSSQGEDPPPSPPRVITPPITLSPTVPVPEPIVFQRPKTPEPVISPNPIVSESDTESDSSTSSLRRSARSRNPAKRFGFDEYVEQGSSRAGRARSKKSAKKSENVKFICINDDDPNLIIFSD
ncbi:unnamed protein product [Orchesella dallaii]|uniref:Uncharacterized protein n=1 Tax=Orchesella dallaii TaxID=48710 RepID=A0ABP1PJQ7_9HEXA